MNDHLNDFLIVSLAFIIASSVTLGFVLPLQTLLLSGSQLEIGLLFLPHGVRILAFHFLGWRAILHMLPASYLFMILTNGFGANLDLLSPLVSMLACYIGYKVGVMIFTKRPQDLSFRMWKFLVVVGSISSLFNGIALSWLQHSGTEIIATLGYLIGDVSGLIACFLMLMYAFRLARLMGRVNPN
jgi:hypothetical protein